MTKNKIVVNNPTIWRPLLAIEDAVTCYLRSIQADMSINGIFNVASGNYTIGTVADQFLDYFSGKLGKKIDVDIKNVTDFRNYKVSAEKSKNNIDDQVDFRGNRYKDLKQSTINKRRAGLYVLNENVTPQTGTTPLKYTNKLYESIKGDKKGLYMEHYGILHQYGVNTKRRSVDGFPITITRNVQPVRAFIGAGMSEESEKKFYTKLRQGIKK